MMFDFTLATYIYINIIYIYNLYIYNIYIYIYNIYIYIYIYTYTYIYINKQIMEIFAKTAKDLQSLTVFTKNSKNSYSEIWSGS